MAEHIDDIIWSVNGEDFRLEYLNPAAGRIYGRSVQAFFDNPTLWLEVIHPDDRETLERRHDELVEQSKAERYYRIIRPDGSIVWLHDSAWATRDAAGRLQRLCGISRDVTAQLEKNQRTLEQQSIRSASGEAEEVVGALVDVSEHHGLDQRLQKLGEQLPGFVYQYQRFPDGSGRFPYASGKSWEIYGAGPAELLESDTPVLDTIHPDDYARVVETIQQSAATLEPWICEYRICHPKGHELWASGRATPERLADGSIIWHGFITDITQYRQTQLALEASEQRYRQIAENLSDLVCLHATDPEARYRFVSRSARQILGYAPEELIGRSAFELIHPEDRDRIIDSSHQKVLAGQQEEGIEYRYRHRGGHYLWLETKTIPLMASNGHIIGLQTISRDVTKRREVKDALRALVLRQERILEAAGEGIYGIDVHGNINFLNPAAAIMLGWQLNEIQGMNTHHLFHHSFKDGAPLPPESSIVLQALNSGQQLRAADEWFLRRDGSGFAVELVASPLIEDGDVTGCVVVFQDITERKRSEALLERLSATDSLTEVANRRYFLQRLEQELARKNRHDSAASLLMFDADHFKRVNDHWGHAAGDEVLRQLSRTCQGMLRGSDLLGRLGGEEFAVLLPETDLNGARLFAERLRHAIEALEVPYAETTITFTLSLGITELEMGDTPESALERADRAMYRAKQSGRNRCCSETLDTMPLQ